MIAIAEGRHDLLRSPFLWHSPPLAERMRAIVLDSGMRRLAQRSEIFLHSRDGEIHIPYELLGLFRRVTLGRERHMPRLFQQQACVTESRLCPFKFV